MKIVNRGAHRIYLEAMNGVIVYVMPPGGELNLKGELPIIVETIDSNARRTHRGDSKPIADESKFTARELEIMGRVADGQMHKEIAFALGVSPRCIDKHVSNIYTKAGISGHAMLTRLAIQLGMSRLYMRKGEGE